MQELKLKSFHCDNLPHTVCIPNYYIMCLKMQCIVVLSLLKPKHNLYTSMQKLTKNTLNAMCDN